MFNNFSSIINGSNNGQTSSISMSGSNNKVTINGKTIQVPSGNVSIINGKIFVNGKEYIDDDLDSNVGNGTVNIVIHGDVEEVSCSGSVEVDGNVLNNIDCGGSVNVKGGMNGNIDCGGSVSITGGHRGYIDAGGSVSTR